MKQSVVSQNRIGRCLRSIALVFLACVGTVTSASSESMASAANRAPIVTTQEGLLRGTRTEALSVFKGVRYGESAGGARRFRPPMPVRAWKGVRNAKALGSQCMQVNEDLPAWQDPSSTSEDCLFLNVWSPRRSEKLPVMVFLHGGAYLWGSGGVRLYDGAALAQRGDVIVITVNHRLNAFGYMYLPELADRYGDAANLGQQDLVEALRWVRRNVAAFGGDPDNVTIFGESGGGGKVSSLLGMPSAKGLFHKAIVQSGSVLRLRSRQQATSDALAVLEALGLKRIEMDKLRTVSAARLLKAARAVAERGGVESGLKDIVFSPVLEPRTLPFDLATPESRLLWQDIPLLVGTNEAESVFPLGLTGSLPEVASEAALLDKVQAFGRTARQSAEQLITTYREHDPSASLQQLLVSITTDQWMGADGLEQAELKAALPGAPVYAYRFGWKDPCFGGAWAAHAAELPFVFDKLELGPLWDAGDTAALRTQGDPEGARLKLRDAMIAAWAGFARLGTPANQYLPDWPRYTLEERATMRFDGRSAVVHDPLGARIRSLLRR